VRRVLDFDFGLAVVFIGASVADCVAWTLVASTFEGPTTDDLLSSMVGLGEAMTSWCPSECCCVTVLSPPSTASVSPPASTHAW